MSDLIQGVKKLLKAFGTAMKWEKINEFNSIKFLLRPVCVCIVYSNITWGYCIVSFTILFIDTVVSTQHQQKT